MKKDIPYMFRLINKKPSLVHFLSIGSVVLYVVMSGIYNERYGSVDPNKDLSILLNLTFFMLAIWITATIICEMYVLLAQKKIHKVAAIVLIMVNLVMASFASLAIALTGIQF